MNFLWVYTEADPVDGYYLVSWRTGLATRGRLRVHVPPALPDSRIAAELGAMRHLLEDRDACGNAKTGKGLNLKVSCGAIRKLMQADSAKEHLVGYAAFLRTRFVGCAIDVANRDTDWVREEGEWPMEEIVAKNHSHAVIQAGELGDVALTGHAMERFIEHMGVSPENAFKRIKSFARDVRRVEVSKAPKHLLKHRREGRFGYDEKRNLMYVVTDADRLGLEPRLVTIYLAEGAASA